MTLRPYQQGAVDAALEWMKKSVAPAVIEGATGCGKSHIIAEIAEHVHFLTGKKILCLAPSAELVTQNRAKYLASGHRAGIFSASAGGRDLRYPVVFGSPLTVKNAISRFGDEYALVILDECDLITPTVKAIIEAMRTQNPKLRVIGLTATPYRLGSGYIFHQWPNGASNGDDTARDPYFEALIYRVLAHDLIDQGYLTKPVIGAIHTGSYDTAGLDHRDAAAVDRAYHGHGRLTASIVADVVAQSADRRGVMFFAATVRHAQEVMASLPPELSAIVTGATPTKERAEILRRFLAQTIKYIVNVSVLTVGFDAPHVDVIAVLRKTESVRLLQQIVGRGLRLYPGKDDLLVLDYTTNIEDHCPHGDLFDPKITAGKPKGDTGFIECTCPWCMSTNTFKAVQNDSGYGVDDNGYFTDLEGEQVKTEWGPMPAHFGRRCMGRIKTGSLGTFEQCEYRWTYKECPHCEAQNDIAARYCTACKGEIVDPNEKLVADFRALKKDPTRLQTDEIVSMSAATGISRAGNKTLRVEIVTLYRQFTVWFQPEATHSRGMRDWAKYQAATTDQQPKTVTYKMDPDTKFYNVLDWNREPDHAPAT